MLGQFWYGGDAADAGVVMHLSWIDSEPMAKVTAPTWAIERLKGLQDTFAPQEEYIRLPFALSYAILLSCLANLTFTISGDASAWPAQWGNLLEGQLREFRVPAPIGQTT